METEIIKNLTQRPISICCNEKLLEDELNYLRNVFIKVNDYPPKLVDSMIKLDLEKNSSDEQEVTANATSKQKQLVLTYADKRGNNIIWKMNRQLNMRLKDLNFELNFHQGFNSKIKQSLNIGMT